MKERTDNEIWEKVHELWPEAEGHGHGWSDYFSVERKDGHLDIVVAKMYSDDGPRLTFDHIQALAEFFDTMKVETEEELTEGGCESCDHGSKYGFVLRISPGDPFQKLPSFG